MSKELDSDLLLHEVKQLIEQSKRQIAVSVNTALSLLYWEIGKRINQETLNAKRAEYGKQMIATLAEQLTLEHGNSSSEKNLRRMIQFADVSPDKQIVASVMRKLSWTHIRELIPIEDPLKLDFYIEYANSTSEASEP